MKYHKMVIYLAGLIFCLCNTFSCADKYGRVNIQWDAAQKMSIDMLIENSRHYKIYFSGLSHTKPSAILFDPISDDRKIITHQWWVPVENPEQIKEIVKWLQAEPFYPPKSYSIIGQDNKLYGYLYSYIFYVVTKTTEANVLWIDYIPQVRALEIDAAPSR